MGFHHYSKITYDNGYGNFSPWGYLHPKDFKRVPMSDIFQNNSKQHIIDPTKISFISLPANDSSGHFTPDVFGI